MSMWVVLEQGEGPESLDEGYGPAKSLAVNLDALDAMARRLGLEPLGGFVHDYAEELEDVVADEGLDEADLEAALVGMGDAGPWYDPGEALRTASALLGEIRGLPAGERERWGGVAIALQSVVAALEFASREGTRFHFGVEY